MYRHFLQSLLHLHVDVINVKIEEVEDLLVTREKPDGSEYTNSEYTNRSQQNLTKCFRDRQSMVGPASQVVKLPSCIPPTMQLSLKYHNDLWLCLWTDGRTH